MLLRAMPNLESMTIDAPVDVPMLLSPPPEQDEDAPPGYPAPNLRKLVAERAWLMPQMVDDGEREGLPVVAFAGWDKTLELRKAAGCADLQVELVDCKGTMEGLV